MSEGGEKRESKSDTSGGWTLDPVIERRLSSRDTSLDEMNNNNNNGRSFASFDETQQQLQRSPSPIVGLVNVNRRGGGGGGGGGGGAPGASGANVNPNQNPSAVGGAGSSASLGPSVHFVDDARQPLDSTLMYSNIPGLGSSMGFPREGRQQSFSSLNLPGGHVGSQPHSRRSTPANGMWMERLDLTRLFSNIRREKADAFVDDTLDAISTPDKRARSNSRRGTPAKQGQDLLDDDDDDSEHSFRETLEGRDKIDKHAHSLDAHVKSRSGNWLAR